MSPDPTRPPLWDPLVDRPSTPPHRLPPPVPGTPPQAPGPAATRSRPATSKRKRPARGARAGALMMSCAATGALTYWFAGTNSTQAASDAIAALPAPAATSPATTGSATTPSTSGTTATTAPAATSGTAGSTSATEAAAATTTAFDGSVVDTRYGPVQVQVQITDGAISDVAVIQYPDGDNKSVRINARALPELRTEVLTAQSADVDTVSGATYTSDAYATSLQSAIDAARSAGVTQIA